MRRAAVLAGAVSFAVILIVAVTILIGQGYPQGDAPPGVKPHVGLVLGQPYVPGVPFSSDKLEVMVVFYTSGLENRGFGTGQIRRIEVRGNDRVLASEDDPRTPGHGARVFRVDLSPLGTGDIRIEARAYMGPALGGLVDHQSETIRRVNKQEARTAWERPVAEASDVEVKDGRVYVLSGAENGALHTFDAVTGEPLAVQPLDAKHPRSLHLGEDRSLMLADTGNNRISLYKKAGDLEWALKTDFGQGGHMGAGNFSNPWCSHVYVADTGNNRIANMDGSTRYGPGDEAMQFMAPRGVQVDTGNNRIQLRHASGVIAFGGPLTLRAGSGFREMTALLEEREAIMSRDMIQYLRMGMPGPDTPAANEFLSAAQQRLAEVQARIDAVRPEDPYLSTHMDRVSEARIIVSPGGDLLQPSDLAWDKAFYYVADTGNNRVVWFHRRPLMLFQELSPELSVALALGGGTDPGMETASLSLQHRYAGEAAGLGLETPLGLALDPEEAKETARHMYVADTGNDRVVKIALPTR